jgi:5'-nucleotidase
MDVGVLPMSIRSTVVRLRPLRILTLTIAFGYLLSALAPTRAVSATITVKIIAFNDFHGNLQSGSMVPRTGQPVESVGGADYLAAYVAQLESENADHVVVAAGDLVGASPLISAFYHDEATIEAMNALGLEFAAVGNHEFDAGPRELLRKQQGGCYPTGRQSCLENHAFAGAAFQYLAANVVNGATGKTLLPPFGIKDFPGVRVAFIGVGLRATPSIVTPQGVAGLEFADEADSVNALVPRLKADGANAVVVLIHQGGTQSPAPGGTISDVNGCAGDLGGPARSPIVGIVSRLRDGVDLVVSGHTHKAYNCRLPNSVGRLIPVTEAGDYGHIVSDIDLEFDGGHVTHVAASNIVVSHSAADAPNSPVHPFLSAAPVIRIRQLLTDYAAAVAPLANQRVGTLAAPLTNAPGPNGEEPAGALIADSELAATSSVAMGGSVMAFVNPGGVRSPGFDVPHATYPRDVTYQEAFAVRPFGNTLVTMTLTAADIKDLLEEQFAGCNGQTGNRILQVSNGLHVEWQLSAPLCHRVMTVTLRSPVNGGAIERIVDHGVVQHPSKSYRITVDNYLAAGGDEFSVLSRARDLRGGPQDIDALVGYLSATFKAPRAPYDPKDPALNLPRQVRLP